MRLLLILILALPVATAQTYTTANELFTAITSTPEPTSSYMELRMAITTSAGLVLERNLATWAQGTTHRLITFTAPADIAGAGFLSVTDDDGTEHRSIYLPALQRVRSIAGGQETEAFFGSDFSYADMAGFDPTEYTLTLDQVTSNAVYVVTAVPLNPGTYTHLVLHIPEEALIPTRVEYYAGADLKKVLTVPAYRKAGPFTVPTERRMETIVAGEVYSYTQIWQEHVELNPELPENVFTEQFLEDGR